MLSLFSLATSTMLILVGTLSLRHIYRQQLGETCSLILRRSEVEGVRASDLGPSDNQAKRRVAFVIGGGLYWARADHYLQKKLVVVSYLQ